MIHIYHHLGLGDHIICNGLVRYFHKEHNGCKLFCYPHNKKNVEYMYRDLNNFELVIINSDFEADSYIAQNGLSDTIKVGFDRLPEFMPPSTFDVAFYQIANLDFSIRLSYFHIERDLKREEELLERLNPTGDKFIFIHDDASRGFKIDESRIESNYKKIYNDNSILLFDYITLLDKAEEVHVMQSSFKDLINSYDLRNTKFFLHEYVRNYSELLDSKGYNKFKNLK
jgi:hypothetical protein